MQYVYNICYMYIYIYTYSLVVRNPSTKCAIGQCDNINQSSEDKIPLYSVF